MGLAWFLDRLVGRSRCIDLVLLGRVLTSREALEWGLVNEIVPDEDLSDRTAAVALALSELSQLALRHALSNFGDASLALHDYLTVEAARHVECSQSEECRSAARTLLERRRRSST